MPSCMLFIRLSRAGSILLEEMDDVCLFDGFGTDLPIGCRFLIFAKAGVTLALHRDVLLDADGLKICHNLARNVLPCRSYLLGTVMP